MGCGSWELFRDWYDRTLEQQCCRNSHLRQPLWTEAAAVGDEVWIEDLAGALPRSWRRIEYVVKCGHGASFGGWPAKP